ncbi:alpha/beta-hydrolase [Phellopilus nigrolimitatus]|nr:alpha/beta-hydrolase [Phellopilus nigrolimitatus]
MANTDVTDPGAAVVPAAKMHTATVIFCHGLGQTTTFHEFDVQFLAQRLPFVKWVCPQARKQPVSYNRGERHPSWFDIWNFPPHINEFDDSGVAESIAIIEQYILHEMHDGIDQRRILLVGFGQGAALCLMTALTTLNDIGGAGSLSGWIPHKIRDVCFFFTNILMESVTKLSQNIVQNDPSIPIFWAHGDADTEIPLRYGRNSIEFLRQRLGMTRETLHYIEYADLGHETSEDVLKDLASWIIDILASNAGETA